MTADDVVAYLTKASPEERWSILQRVALATRDSAPPTPVRRPLELVDQTRDDVESETPPPPTIPSDAEPASHPIAPASRDTSPGICDSAPPTESIVPPTLPWSMPPSASPQSSTQPRDSVPDAAELLFEAMHDLTLLEAAPDGARFCLEAALRAVPCLAGLVHLRDPASLELVVVHTLGPRADVLLRTRTSQADPLVARAVRAAGPVVVTYGGLPGSEETPCARHTFFDPWSAALVPVMHGGQLLGLIEMIDPLDGAPFGEAAQDALAYVAERLARFLVDHPAAAISA